MNKLHKLHQWSSGRIVPCHGTDPGSIPGWCTMFFNLPLSRIFFYLQFPFFSFSPKVYIHTELDYFRSFGRKSSSLCCPLVEWVYLANWAGRKDLLINMNLGSGWLIAVSFSWRLSGRGGACYRNPFSRCMWKRVLHSRKSSPLQWIYQYPRLECKWWKKSIFTCYTRIIFRDIFIRFRFKTKI